MSTLDRRSVAFESSLERDFYTLLDFDLGVRSFREQPVTIFYHGQDGRQRTYTPDVIVYYEKQPDGTRRKPTLFEVKMRSDLFANLVKYRPKLRAAYRFANQQGWRFEIITEREIRGVYLENVKFLRHFYQAPEGPEWNYAFEILEAVAQKRVSYPEEIIASIACDSEGLANATRTLWELAARRMIGVDMTQPLSMKSRVWSCTR